MTTPRSSNACHIMLSSLRYHLPTGSRAGVLGGFSGMGVPAVGQQQAGNCLTPHLSVCDSVSGHGVIDSALCARAIPVVSS